jgi:PAS domain S-box-containing protein
MGGGSVPQDGRAQAPASKPPDWAADLATTAADVDYALRLEPERALEYISPTAECSTGHDPSEPYDDPNPLFGLIDPRDAATLAFAHSGDFGEVTTFMVRWLSKDGRESWTESHVARRDRSAPRRRVAGRIGGALPAAGGERLRCRRPRESGDDRVASPSISTAIGWSSRDWVGHSVREYVHPDDLERLTADHAVMDVDRARVSRFRVLPKEGIYHWVQAHARPYIDASGARAGLVAAARIVDHEVAVDAELERRATRDELTGVLNRSEVLREGGQRQPRPCGGR